jgi:hypothetical protein
MSGVEGGRVVVCVPRTNPRQGNIIYDEAVFDAAQVRIDLARKIMREEGIEAIGEVGDPDPYTATMDAIAEYRPDEIVISTYPAASSGWLRRDLIERLTQMIDRARAADLICAGMIADPDPYNAIMNALQFFRVDDIVISTLPATRSGWMRADLVERVRRASNKPVEHVESTEAEAAA